MVRVSATDVFCFFSRIEKRDEVHRVSYIFEQNFVDRPFGIVRPLVRELHAHPVSRSCLFHWHGRYAKISDGLASGLVKQIL